MDINRHFVAFWKTNYKDDLVSYAARVLKIFASASVRADIDTDIRAKIAQTKYSDYDLAAKIIETLRRCPPWKSNTGVSDRVQDRVSKITDMAGSPKSYLDYGCGDGSITLEVANHYNLSAENAFGVDIGTLPRAPGITWQDELPERQFDLVTALVSLHHIENISPVLAAVRETLIIREHDFDGSFEMYGFLQAVHLINIIANNEPYNEEYLESTRYRSRNKWTQDICKNGFALIKYSDYSGRNPQKLYYAAYKKI